MPNANAHDRITYIFAPVTLVGAQYYWQRPVVSATATAAMLFAGLMFGPDLDLHSRPYRRWGPLRFIWKPYQYVLEHRSVLSHGPILGTIIRVLYFCAMATLLAATVLYLYSNFVHGRQTTWEAQYRLVNYEVGQFWAQTDREYLLGGFAGLCFGALTHTAADLIWSQRKRLRRIFR